MNELTEKIRRWAVDRNLHDADPHKQIMKLGEEFGEVCAAMAKNQKLEDLELEIGDMVVAQTILAMQLGSSIDRCAELAYQKIKDRTGEMINGIYVKQEDLE